MKKKMIVKEVFESKDAKTRKEKLTEKINNYLKAKLTDKDKILR